MKIMRYFYAICLLAFVLSAGKALAATYYVDFDDGLDSRAGTSIAESWKHCPGDLSATNVAGSVTNQPGDTIIFKGGVHYRGSITCKSSGTGGSRITYDGNTGNTFGTGRAIIDGSEPITSLWTACSSSADCGGNTNWSNIYKTTVPATTDVFTVNMYNGNQMLWPAQNPNITNADYPDDLATFTPIYCDQVTRTSLTDTNAFIQTNANYYAGCYLRLWGNPNLVRILPITNYIPAQNMIQFPDTGTNALYTDKTVYYAVVNNLPNLDQSGEFAVANGTMYLWPKPAGDPNTNGISTSLRRVGIDINGKSHLNIRGFVIQKMTSGANQTAAGCAILDRFGASNITISDNEITKNFSQEKEGSIKMYATGAHGTNVVIEGNTIYENPHNPGMIVTIDDSIVRSNTLSRNGATGIDFYGCQRSQLLNNTLTEHMGVHANGITLYLGNKDCLVAYNKVFDGLIALTLKHATNITVAYNVLHTAVDGPTAIIWSSTNIISTNITFCNNVMLNSGASALGWSEDGSYNISVYNNILDGSGVPSTNVDIYGRTNVNFTSHNLYTSLAWNQAPQYGWTNGPGEIVETNKTIVFADPNNRNFDLKNGSPAVDSGLDWGQARDLPGNTKVGPAWDIGAYEYQALLEILTTNLPYATVGSAYSKALTAVGGTAPYTWAVTAGGLPPGLGLVTSSGTITGTPTSVTTSNFSIRVTDGVAASVTNAFSLTTYNPLIITTTDLPSGTAGSVYSTTLAASGGAPPYTWAVSSGTLPPGLGLVASSGSITGTPATIITSSFSLRATDSVAASATNAFSLTIAADTNSVNLRVLFDFGSTNFLTAGNWNSAISTNVGLVVTNAIDVYGAPRNINLSLSNKVGNLIYSTGVSNSTIYPSSAQRDNIGSTKAFTYRIEGVDPTARYSLTFFASRNGTNSGTIYSIGSSNVFLDANANTSRTVAIGEIQSDTSGNINFTVNPNVVSSSNYGYISVMELKKTASAPTANNQNVTVVENTATNLVLVAYDTDSTNLSYLIVTGPAHGTLSGLNTNSGAVTYTPTNNYYGTDSFTFRAYDGGLYGTGTVSVTVIATHSLAYAAGANGAISGTTPQMVLDGGSGTAVTAVPNTGYHFVSWSDLSTANPRTDTGVISDISVTANFAINTYTLIYSAGTNGAISGTATQTVNYGASSTAVLASGNTGYHFVNWSDSSTSNPRTDTGVTTNITVTANFAINTYTLTYTADANGMVSGTATQTVTHGSSGSAITATANSGYYFTAWSDSLTNNPRTDVNVTNSLSVTASFVPANPQLWVTEYYLTTNQFTGTNYSLALNQSLASNYFILVRGSRIGDSTSDPDNNNVRVAAVPGGRGDLPASASSTNLTLSRRVADFTWEGVITVVECLNSASAGGFKLLDVMNTSLTSTSGVDTCATAWSDMSRVVPFGGYRGGGAMFNQDATSNAQVVATHVRLYPSGSNTINWVREAAGQTLMNASMTTFVIEWGSEWIVQYVNVVGTKGGSGANATNEFTTAAINSVVRSNTWVWGTGTRNGSGLGTCAEGCLVTLGNGVSTNANETTVAVGSEYTNAYNFAVYTMTHPKLVVDHRKAIGGSTVLDLAVTMASITNAQARLGWVYNGMNSTQGGYHPRATFWSRFTGNSTVTISRGHDGNTFSAWVQAVDFSPLDN